MTNDEIFLPFPPKHQSTLHSMMMIPIKKYAVLSIFVTLPFATSPTIAELIAANPSLSRVASAASQNPSWSSGGTITVFAPTNNAIEAASLPSGNVGVLTSRQSLPITSTYALVQDLSSTFQLVYLNSNPGSSSPLAVQIRSALVLGTATSYQTADNGFLYVIDVAIAPPPTVSAALQALRCFEFANMIAKASLTNFVDQLVNVTIFAPTDDAYAAIYDPVLSKLSSTQLRAYVLYHIIPSLVYSNNFPSGNYSTLLANNNMPVVASRTGVMLPGATTEIFDQADNFVANGVIHRISFFMNPPSLPSANEQVIPANVPAGSGPFDPNNSSPTVTVSTSTSRPTKNSELRQRDAYMGGVALAAGMIAMLV